MLLFDYIPTPPPEEECYHPHHQGSPEGLPEMAGLIETGDTKGDGAHGASMIGKTHK